MPGRSTTQPPSRRSGCNETGPSALLRGTQQKNPKNCPSPTLRLEQAASSSPFGKPAMRRSRGPPSLLVDLQLGLKTFSESDRSLLQPDWRERCEIRFRRRAATGLGFGLDWPTFSESFVRDDYSQRGVKRHRKMLRRKGILSLGTGQLALQNKTCQLPSSSTGKMPYSPHYIARSRGTVKTFFPSRANSSAGSRWASTSTDWQKTAFFWTDAHSLGMDTVRSKPAPELRRQVLHRFSVTVGARAGSGLN